MYLLDTNIFLEILLKQDKSDKCKAFLNDNIGLLNISDFSFIEFNEIHLTETIDLFHLIVFLEICILKISKQEDDNDVT